MLENGQPRALQPVPRTTRTWHLVFWGTVVLGIFTLLYVLRSVLAPFVAGMIMAYLLDPIADRLQSWGVSRLWATVVITLGFLLLLIAGLLFALPVLYDQVSRFAANVPNYVNILMEKGDHLMTLANEVLTPGEMERISTVVQDIVRNGMKWLTEALTALVSGGVVLVGVVAVLVVVPVIAFYMLRDWDRMTGVIDTFLPRPYAPVIREQLRLMDQTIAGFIRGQVLVCLALGSFYGISLSLVGLDLAMVVGLTSGFLSFIPYVGTITGFVLSMGLAFAQFSDWLPISVVFGIFMCGQLLEGNFLTPKLVGDRVGLHPVWIIFALLAGGGLFGFVGILLAVPVAAAIGVLVRFFLSQYVRSSFYTGIDSRGQVIEPLAADCVPASLDEMMNPPALRPGSTPDAQDSTRKDNG
ncbi:AI-2E family transporter [Phaeovibrio sulfidiphilus]|uniref:AI-2E family transporter n=1 Tax=Phaeovibrio sulfidiphilus TaxID=1220600 RepID=A0A8J6YNE5_9PROT|nr:AI-2E family transporter [Phaeovibrio sulfidiphilus]MBE1237840.1 AI-2E family transporter [Phaeovibrio sulfidiphilus]